MRSFRAPGVDRRDVQDSDQSSVDVEDRRTGTAQVFVPRAKMLPPVNGDRPLLDDAGTDTVRALEFFRPHTAEPSPPVPELVRFRLFAAMLDGDARGVTKQNSVPCLANHLVKAINFILGTEDELVERLTKLPKLGERQNAWRLTPFGIDAVPVSGPVPGRRHPFDARWRLLTANHRVNLFGVLGGRIDRP